MVTSETGMGLRLELFVRDMAASIAFYRGVFGFELLRRETGYASLGSGGVILGLGPIAKLSADEGYFTRGRLAGDRGAGVEIVLEVGDIAAYRERVEGAGYRVIEGLRLRPWGLTDFRLTDPDGYYLRLTSRL